MQDWPCGPTDKASDYESGDCRFESCQDQHFYSPRKTIIRNGYFWCDDSNHICNNFMFYNSQSIFGKEENGRKPVNVLHSLKIAVDVERLPGVTWLIVYGTHIKTVWPNG